jgi:transposase InsO family protein
MPWKEVSSMSELVQFVAEYEKNDGASFAELCRRFGISRKTGYKWVERWKQEGSAGLVHRSRAPLTRPQSICPELEGEILAARGLHRTWGPKKILAWLARHRPGLALCATSTAADVLSRHGLAVPRGRARHRATPSRSPLADCLEPNKTWCADFKGHFLLGDGTECNPLTITDAHTRYVLRCQGLGSKTDHGRIQPLFEAAFEEYGLPERIRTDNGPPFATTGLGGLSRLSVWWIELGIRPERIRPAKPQENGRHERMHRTLKAETTRPPARSLRAQQHLFDEWRRNFNEERPHEALGQETPASLYVRSDRRLTARRTCMNTSVTRLSPVRASLCAPARIAACRTRKPGG